MAKIQRAILSVTDKTGLVEFARKLAGMGVELVSTGGTAKLLRDAGVTVKDISELTGFPEMLDGRVKTLHPKVHGGILHRREMAAPQRRRRARHSSRSTWWWSISMPSRRPRPSRACAFEELIENIDIGGPSMIRSAAKNFQDVAVVTSPADYEAHRRGDGERRAAALSAATKWRLAQKAFATTAAYDSAIASTLERVSANGHFELQTRGRLSRRIFACRFSKVMDLRYGENPHQKAAMYSDGSGRGVANGRQIQGKELSYNNIVDLQAAWDLAAGVRRDRLRHHQAHQPLRHRHRQGLSPRPTRRPWSAIRCRLSAA